MREIEYKAKNKRTKTWVYGSLIVQKFKLNVSELDKELYTYKYSIKYLNKNGKYSICEVDEKTIGEYTGQEDKFNKKIFENDEVYVISEDENAFILWDNDTSAFIIQFDGWCATFDNFYGKELEVIGNIHDNPELLER